MSTTWSLCPKCGKPARIDHAAANYRTVFEWTCPSCWAICEVIAHTVPEYELTDTGRTEGAP